MMAEIDASSTRSKSSGFSRYLFTILWAESLMGVRGFLISWASLWAISCQAATFSVWRSCERLLSSSATILLKDAASRESSSLERDRMR